MMLRCFEGKLHAHDYAKYRPEWPPMIYDKLVSYVKDGGGVLHQAVDVGCGTGVCTRLLAERFEKVIGVDVSGEMIAQAPKLANVTYHVSPGEELDFISEESVDAVTCAASIHWMDLKRFYKEVDRILKPGGILASFTYMIHSLTDNKEASECLMRFRDETLLQYFDKNAYGLELNMHELEQPYKEFTRFVDLSFEKNWPLSDFLGYFSTVSATRKLMESGNGKFDKFSDQLLEIYKCDPRYKEKENVSFDNVIVTTSWNIKLNLSRKPKNNI